VDLHYLSKFFDEVERSTLGESRSFAPARPYDQTLGLELENRDRLDWNLSAMAERSYRCHVCGWQGQLEPLDPGDASPCPNCGVYLYPLSWGQTWGFALLLIAAVVGFVFAVVFLLR
jgi:hypothetical protein